ncbi:hypothetical protein BGX23_004758 [Mortierella sp. AD031]|nr:hypothetical protein BGX23_004758 [Mortierella sp. AD031]
MVLEMVPQLTDLSIGPAVLIDSPTTTLSKVARSLKRLELDRVKVADRSWYDDPIQSSQAMSALALFPELETLIMVWNDLPPQCQLELIRKSPNLRSLTWKRGTQLLVQAWLSSALPIPTGLTSLDVAHSHIEDRDMARILVMAPYLTSLNVRSTPFGVEGCVRLLEHHAPNMKMLDVSGCLQVTSKMVVAMLSCMPALSRFCSDRVEGRDIAKPFLAASLEESPLSRVGLTGEELLRSTASLLPWACLDLAELEITIVGLRHGDSTDSASTRTLVYEQLSRLRRLEELCLGEDTSTLRPGEEWLDLTLAHDLDRLSSLARLKRLDIRKLKAKMAQEEIEWMAQKWGRLEIIRGGLNCDLTPAEARALHRQLKSKRPDIVHFVE